jgi:hypothetical protein
MLRAAIHHFLGGCLGVFARYPHRISDRLSTNILRLSRAWSDDRCGRSTPKRYLCRGPQNPCALAQNVRRRHQSYEFGPLGWSGGPPEHEEGDSLDFLGMRLDVLSRGSAPAQRAVISHEMAHERQKFCPIRGTRPRWSRSTLGIELEAEREATACLWADNHRVAAGSLWLVAWLRAPFTAVFSILSVRALLILSPLIAGLLLFGAYLTCRVWPMAPFPAVATTRAISLLFVCAGLSIILYKFFSGVMLSAFYAREDKR